MKLLSIVSFFTLAVAANACGCVDYGNVFIERVSELFFSDDVYYTIGIEYDTWYASASPTTDEECAQGFIDILIGFEKGSYTIQTAPSSGRDQIANWIYGCAPIVNGCVAKDSTYTNMCKQYVTECGFDTWEPVEVEGSTVGTTEAAPTPSFNDTMGAYAEFYYTLCDYQGIKKSSYVYEQIAVCYTQFANDGMTSEEIDGNCNQCTQLGLYYIMNPEYVTTEPEPPVTQFSVEQFYAVLGYVFSSAELRIQFATSFYNYIALCPSAPEYCQWQKVIKDVCMINEGGYTCESSGEIGGTEMVNACVELTYELIAEGNVEVISFLTIYMTKVLKMTAVTSTVTFTGTVSMYSFLFSCVSESAGFASWSVYIEFYARWEAFCGTSTDLDWEDCEAWVTEFFFLCCHWTMPEVSTTYLPETSELPTDVTEVTATGSEATCVISTPEEECAYILMYFKFIGQIYGNVEWRTKLNDKCREHKKEKPDSSNSDKAKAFCGATHDCARHISGSGSGSNETPFPPEDEDPTGGPPEGEDSWEYFVNFAIEVFLVGDFSLLTEGACTMARYGDLIPTSAPKSGEGSGGSGGSGSGEGPTVSPTCDEIKSPSGIFIFFELIAIECGFYETSWFSLWIIKFKAIFLSLDWDCGCWGDFSWHWSIDWIELILEFLKAMTCGCVPSPEPGPTPAPNGVWTIYRFFTWFCSDVEYRYKFECFMSWYFELKGYTQFEELSFSEAYECCSLFIDYMIICVDNPDTPTKPEPASGLYITYDTFIYTFQYYCNFKGSTKFVEMASEKAAKCDDKASGSSHESSEEDNCPDSYGADYCVFVCQYMAISMGCWEDAEFQSNYWSQFMIGVNVAKGQSSEDGCWTQLQMLIDFIIQIICDWDQA